ncbi:TIGR01459 family HAD-type hydrolase, partial [Mesorhizobium sp. M2A.F.Ca.ET.040.01.1.1]
VCVGDSVEHDIAGGQAAGVATALVLSGILVDSGDPAGLLDEFNAHADYMLDAFRWR